MEIVGTTKLLGVIGDPIEHSLSPVMHNAVLRELARQSGGQLDYVYLPFRVKTLDLARALEGFAAIGVVGFNATLPHKQALLPLLSNISPLAQIVGAVNTVWRTEGGWEGTNTDVLGFQEPLHPFQKDWGGITALILGYGGAARAVVAGCGELGCGTIAVSGRDRHKLKQFHQSWQATPWGERVQMVFWEDVDLFLSQVGLIINTTPVGMTPRVGESPLTAGAMAHLKPGAIAYDLIYTPSPTLFLQQAEAVGAVTIDGREMLVQQGAAALEIWLSTKVPVAVMAQALAQHLDYPH